MSLSRLLHGLVIRTSCSCTYASVSSFSISGLFTSIVLPTIHFSHLVIQHTSHVQFSFSFVLAPTGTVWVSGVNTPNTSTQPLAATSVNTLPPTRQHEHTAYVHTLTKSLGLC